MSIGLRQFHATLLVHRSSKGAKVDLLNVVVGKNYRLQNIQLSKISMPGTSRQSVYVGLPTGALLSQRSTAGADAGGRETQEPHSRTETLFQKSTRHREGWLANRSSFASCCRPTFALLRYGGQPSRTFMSEGWWRIPGSNR
jgi:hypothetical protein